MATFNNEVYPVTKIREVKVDDRHAFLYRIATDIGEIDIVQHEDRGYEIMTDYMGFDQGKAGETFNRAARKMMREVTA